MLTDPFGRAITYLRISVTDRCNYRCSYCMPQEGVPFKEHADVLRYETIVAVVREAASLGIIKVKITGGEPLVRRDIEVLIGAIAGIAGVSDLGMTTNGSLLTPDKARALKQAGLMRVNISLDTLDPARFAGITRRGRLDDVLRGIDAALEAGLVPVKVNMVVFDTTEQREIDRMREFCAAKGMRLQTISHFSLESRASGGAIETERPPRCDGCNRLRLTADGYLKPCLFSDREIKIDPGNIRNCLIEAVRGKPAKGRSCSNRAMSQIGG